VPSLFTFKQNKKQGASWIPPPYRIEELG